MFATTLITHQRHIDEGNEYAPDNTPYHIIRRPLYSHHFYIRQEYNNTHTENGGKEEDHAEEDEDAGIVVCHMF